MQSSRSWPSASPASSAGVCLRAARRALCAPVPSRGSALWGRACVRAQTSPCACPCARTRAQVLHCLQAGLYLQPARLQHRIYGLRRRIPRRHALAVMERRHGDGDEKETLGIFFWCWNAVRRLTRSCATRSICSHIMLMFLLMIKQIPPSISLTRGGEAAHRHNGDDQTCRLLPPPPLPPPRPCTPGLRSAASSETQRWHVVVVCRCAASLYPSDRPASGPATGGPPWRLSTPNTVQCF